MGLTPDAIAHRAFTPSVDGYHQGEVRTFLERVAAELRGLLSALPEGRADLAELTTTLHDYEPRMATLNAQIHDVLAELSAATSMMKEAQAETSIQLVVAKQLAADQAMIVSAAESQPRDTIDVVAEHRALLELLSSEHQAVTNQLAAAQKLSADQREAAEYLATAGEQQTNQLAAAQKLSADQREAAEYLATAGEQQTIQLVTADKLIDKQAAANAASDQIMAKLSELATTSAPAPGAVAAAPEPTALTASERIASVPLEDVPASRSAPAEPATDGEVMSLFGSDLDDQPLFSDNANDLLDGVLDDIMGNLNDEGDPI